MINNFNQDKIKVMNGFITCDNQLDYIESKLHDLSPAPIEIIKYFQDFR